MFVLIVTDFDLDDEDTCRATVRMFLQCNLVQQFHIPYDVSILAANICTQFNLKCWYYLNWLYVYASVEFNLYAINFNKVPVAHAFCMVYKRLLHSLLRSCCGDDIFNLFGVPRFFSVKLSWILSVIINLSLFLLPILPILLWLAGWLAVSIMNCGIDSVLILMKCTTTPFHHPPPKPSIHANAYFPYKFCTN